MANDGAGTLIERLAFDQPQRGNPDGADDFGNVSFGEWDEMFRCRGAFTHRHGGESVMQGRLQGRHTVVVRVRAANLTRSVDASWSIRDLTTDRRLNIRDVTHTNDRKWVEFLCESGVAN